jgi:hypothetical protein
VTRDEFIANLRAAADRLPTSIERTAAYDKIAKLVEHLPLEFGESHPVSSSSHGRPIEERLRELETLKARVKKKQAALERAHTRTPRLLWWTVIAVVVLLLSVAFMLAARI